MKTESTRRAQISRNCYTEPVNTNPTVMLTSTKVKTNITH